MTLSTRRSESRVEVLSTIHVVSQQGAGSWVKLWWWQSSWRGCKSSVASQVRLQVRLFLGSSVTRPPSTKIATYIVRLAHTHAMSEMGRSIVMVVLAVTSGSDNCQGRFRTRKSAAQPGRSRSREQRGCMVVCNRV
jgi:hypothetical protein